MSTTETVNIHQAAALTGVKPGTLRAAIRFKRLAATKVPGGVYEILLGDLEWYIANKRKRGRPKQQKGERQ
jgi:hypothetical protein